MQWFKRAGFAHMRAGKVDAHNASALIRHNDGSACIGLVGRDFDNALRGANLKTIVARGAER
jgi:hypothetical protein